MRDLTIRLWEANSGKLLATKEVKVDIQSVAFHSDGKLIFVKTDNSGNVMQLNLSEEGSDWQRSSHFVPEEGKASSPPKEFNLLGEKITEDNKGKLFWQKQLGEWKYNYVRQVHISVALDPSCKGRIVSGQDDHKNSVFQGGKRFLDYKNFYQGISNGSTICH